MSCQQRLVSAPKTAWTRVAASRMGSEVDVYVNKGPLVDNDGNTSKW